MTARLVILPITFLLVLAPHAWATVPTFSKQVTIEAPKRGDLTGNERLQVGASVSVVGSGFALDSVRIRSPKSGSGRVTRTWVLYGRSAYLNNGRSFPLAQLQTTADFTLLNEKGYDRIWNYDFDRYFNTCLKGGYEISASGGNLYCDVHYLRSVEFRQTTRVTKQYPRPRVISTTKTWPNPICEVGATSVDTTSSPLEDVAMVCQDGAAESNSNEVPDCRPAALAYPRTTTTVAVIAQVKGRPRPRTTVVTDCDQNAVRGPGWVVTSRTPLPAPTVTVTSIERSGPYYVVRGTLVSHYRRNCGIDVYVVTADGASQKSAYVWPATPGETHTWQAWSTFGGQTPTSTASGTVSAYC